MTRISKLLIAATTVLLPASSAFAQGEDATEAPPADGAAGGETTGEAATPPENTQPTDTGTAAPMTHVKSVIDRDVVLPKGQMAALADLGIAHLSVTILGMTSSSTSEGLQIGGAYGVTDKITAGASYALTLNEFEAKGPLDIYGGMQLSKNDKLTVGAGADLSVNFAADNALAINAGLAVRYKLSDKLSVNTGNPYTPGPLGQHLHIGLSKDESATFSLPVGVGFQATPELYAMVNTNIATISLKDPGMGASRVISYGDIIPFGLGAIYAVNNNIDAAVSLTFPDLGSAGDLWAITVGARYFK